MIPPPARATPEAPEAERPIDPEPAAPAFPWATALLVAANLAVHGLVEWRGGAGTLALLAHAGALLPDSLGRGEPVRLVSHAFLHGSVLHVAMNAIVVWRIGGDLERVIGAGRMLALYTMSVLAGAAASQLFSDARLMVGASGGGFGLMGAELAMLLVRPGLVPSHVRGAARARALQNLAINVFASFQPNVAMAAHFGGGLAGFALASLILPRQRRRGSWLATLAGGVAALVLVPGFLHPLRALVLPAPRAFARATLRDLHAFGATAELPLHQRGPSDGRRQHRDPRVRPRHLRRDPRRARRHAQRRDRRGLSACTLRDPRRWGARPLAGRIRLARPQDRPRGRAAVVRRSRGGGRGRGYADRRACAAHPRDPLRRPRRRARMRTLESSPAEPRDGDHPATRLQRPAADRWDAGAPRGHPRRSPRAPRHPRHVALR